jgi:ankyrin repeat protein
MHRAIQQNNRAKIEELITQYDNLNEAAHHGLSPLLLAAESGSPELIKLFTVHGANLQATNINGQNALMLAAAGNHTEAIDWLLKAGVLSISDKDKGGRTALMIAATRLNAKAVEQLLTADATQVNQTDNHGRTSLLQALNSYRTQRRTLHAIRERPQRDRLYSRILNTVQVLLANGANATTPDRYGNTPLRHALSANHPIVVRWLLKYGADPAPHAGRLTQLLKNRAAHGDLESVLTLLEKNVKATGACLSNLLFKPAVYTNRLMTRILLDHGANANHRQKMTHDTPILKATIAGQYPVIEELLAHNANPNIPDREGRTPFIHATRQRNFATMYPLLKGGADPCPDVDNNEFFEAMDKFHEPESPARFSVLPAASEDSVQSFEEDDWGDSLRQLFDEPKNWLAQMKYLWPLKLHYSAETRAFITSLMSE